LASATGTAVSNSFRLILYESGNIFRLFMKELLKKQKTQPVAGIPFLSLKLMIGQQQSTSQREGSRG
jgi:hypothetical protein